MPVLEEVGRYKGLIKDHGVSKSSVQGLPQFVATLLVTHVYNETTEEWEDWAEYGLTIDAFAVLATLDKHGVPVRCFKYDEVIDATDWDGVTYSGLAAMDLKDHPIQFRTQEDTFTDKNGIVITKLKVVTIAGIDAEFGLRKITGKDLTDLDAKFSVGTSKPAAAPAKPKAGKKAPPKAKAAPKLPKRESATEAAETCTEEEAWEAVHAVNVALNDPVPDEIRDNYWQEVVKENAADDDNVTPEEWPVIRDKAIEKIEIPY